MADGEAQGRCGAWGRSQLLSVDLSLLPLTPLSLGLNFPIFKMDLESVLCVERVTLLMR